MGEWSNIAPFNGVFFVSFGIFILLLIVASLLLRKKSEKCRKIVLASSMLFAIVVFIGYKIALRLDPEYSEIRVANNLDAFNWWMELPLHLCNINMLLIPVEMLTGNKRLMGFSFFLAPLGATFALIMPSVGFYDCSIFLLRNVGYYFTHFMVFIGGIALVSFKLFRPTYKDIVPVTLSILAVGMVIFGINMLFRFTGLAPRANYFYMVETEGNAILNLFYSWIPIPGLYTLPCIALILIPYMLIETSIFELCYKLKKKGAKQ